MTRSTAVIDPSLDRFLVAQQLAAPGETASWEPLTGGVSSDIWRVEVGGRTLCVKRALAQLKVTADWKAPVSRNAYEWAWVQFASQHCPENVPRPLAHDEEAGLFAMSFLDPQRHPVWKQLLLRGEVSTDTAAAVGELLGRVHAASARSADLAKAFETIDNFYALRLEPYLVAASLRHPALAPALLELVAVTAGTQHALVHGDVSPKNILVGPKGPVLLDAECAWYGDPAFDLAFCLNHLLLKGAVVPAARIPLGRAFAAMTAAYLRHVDWEPADRLEARAARLLPALLLARVDGKSPVEYITDDGARSLVRDVASALIRDPVSKLGVVESVWSGRVRHVLG
jgi:tRNA A-37 threonylcarbamoyl transferase component Bud32